VGLDANAVYLRRLGGWSRLWLGGGIGVKCSEAPGRTSVCQDQCLLPGASVPAYRATALPAAATVPLGLIEEVVAESGCRERRRRLLPAAAVMVFVLGCCLFSGDGYEEVARKLAGWLGQLAGPGWRVPGASALAKARRRLGAGPFELLFSRLAGPLAGPGTPGAGAFGLVMMAIDGTTLEVPYSPVNVAAFGPPQPGRGAGGGFPLVRLVTVTGCGTRGLAGAEFGPFADSEQKLARQLAARHVLGPGMVVLADRNFGGHAVVAAVTGTGAEVIVRVRSCQHLPVMQALADGSWLSVLPDRAAARRRIELNSARRRHSKKLGPDTSPLPGIPVRVIEFTVTVTGAQGSRSERYRLITTLLDPVQAPAGQVAACYAQRWEAETGYRELKTTLRGPGRVLRSRDAAMVRQEIWALLCACQLLHAQRAAAAAAAPRRLDPDRISFIITLHAIRRNILTSHPRRHIISEILSQPLPARRNRSYPRLLLAKTAARRNASTGHNGTVTYTIAIIRPASTTQPGP